MAVELAIPPRPVLHPALAEYFRRYDSLAQTGIKINLYHADEVAGVAMALDALVLDRSPIECVMVGDSYFMTHLGRDTTTLRGAEEQDWGMATLTALVVEVRQAVDTTFAPGNRPFLLADLPDGQITTAGAARSAALRFTTAGADAVKVELAGARAFQCLETIAAQGVPVLGHLGYTPQNGTLRRYGDSPATAMAIFAAARRARDAGACGLILEMVSEPVNEALSRPAVDALPVYSIFSGRARWGGQSLNAWDAVVRPSKPRRQFPPTAVIDRADVPRAYTPKLIGARLAELMRLTLSGWYPLSPRTSMPATELDWFATVNPWTEP